MCRDTAGYVDAELLARLLAQSMGEIDGSGVRLRKPRSEEVSSCRKPHALAGSRRIPETGGLSEWGGVDEKTETQFQARTHSIRSIDPQPSLSQKAGMVNSVTARWEMAW